MTAIAICSAGAVGAFGAGVGRFQSAWDGGGFRRDLGHASPRWSARRYGVGLVENLSTLATRELPEHDVRRVDRVGILAMLAAVEAIRAAGLPGRLGPRTGLILGSTHGAIGFSVEYHASVVTRGAVGLSALLFSASLLSSAAGTLALALGIQGPAHSVATGATAASDMLKLAELLIASGDVDRVLVVGAEMFHPIYLDAYDALFRLHTRFGRPPDPVKAFGFAEGAVALLLASNADPAMGWIRGSSGSHLGLAWKEPVGTRLATAWAKAGIDPAEVDLFVGGGNNSFVDRLETEALRQTVLKARRESPKNRVGEGFAYTSLLQVLAACLWLAPGERALVQGIHFDGAVGAVAVEAAPR